MNRTFRTLAAIALLSVTSIPAFAAQNGGAERHAVAIRYQATIGVQQLERGSYQVEIVEAAEPILVFKSKDAEIARVRVERQTLDTPASYDSVGFSTGANGAREIVSVTFKGSATTFIVKDASAIAKTN